MQGWDGIPTGDLGELWGGTGDGSRVGLGQGRLERQLCLCVAGERLALHEVPNPGCGAVPSPHHVSPVPSRGEGGGDGLWPVLPSWRGGQRKCAAALERGIFHSGEINLLFLAWMLPVLPPGCSQGTVPPQWLWAGAPRAEGARCAGVGVLSSWGDDREGREHSCSWLGTESTISLGFGC